MKTIDRPTLRVWLRFGLAVGTLAGGVLGLSACRIGDDLPGVGELCDDSADCDDDLGCAPTDVKDPFGERICVPAPDDWNKKRCSAALFGDGECDCGCGERDVDCADGKAASCQHDNCPDGEDPVEDKNDDCA